MEFITNPTIINDYRNQGYIEYAWLFDNGFGLVYKDVLGESLDYIFAVEHDGEGTYTYSDIGTHFISPTDIIIMDVMTPEKIDEYVQVISKW